VNSIENRIEQAAIRKLVGLFEDKGSAQMLLPCELCFDSDGLGVIVGPEIQPIERIGCLGQGLVEDLPERDDVEVNKSMRFGRGHACQGWIQLNGHRARIVRRIAGRGRAGQEFRCPFAVVSQLEFLTLERFAVPFAFSQ